MNKFVDFLLSLVGLCMALVIMCLGAYGFGAELGILVTDYKDTAVLGVVVFGIVSVVGSFMVYAEAREAFAPLNRDNMQHLAGLAVGVVNRYTGKRYTKEERGTRWFSTVAANICANGDAFEWFPYK